MKKYYLIALTLFVGFIFVRATVNQPVKRTPVTPQVPNWEIPADVQAVLDNSCYGCHNSDSKNEKGKKKLMFDKLGELTKAKLVGKLTDISDVVTNGDMPPKKVLENHPEMKLTEETAKTLTDWAANTSQRLME